MLVIDSLGKAKNMIGKSYASGLRVGGSCDRRGRWGNTALTAFSHLQPSKKWAQQSQVTRAFCP